MSVSIKKDKKENVGPAGSNLIPTLPKDIQKMLGKGKSLISTLTPSMISGVRDMVGSNKRINVDDIRRYLKEKQGKGETPKLMPEQNLPERKVPKGEKPNMLDVAGGAKTLNVKKGGLIKKKKPKKAGRLAKRGYGAARK
tara:strand:+ start:341 stop:760 length:420 start_codon:yes stop_codon:yes gene_type:complete